MTQIENIIRIEIALFIVYSLTLVYSFFYYMKEGDELCCSNC